VPKGSYYTINPSLDSLASLPGIELVEFERKDTDSGNSGHLNVARPEQAAEGKKRGHQRHRTGGGSARTNILLSSRKPTPKDHFTVCIVILMHLIYPTACQNTFRLLACTEVGEGQYFLQADLQEPCWAWNDQHQSHVEMVILLCLPQLLLYVIGFPLASALMLYKNRNRLNNARTKYRYGMLYVGLKKDRYYWEVLVCARKAGIFSLSVIGSANTGLAVQTHLAMFVLMAALVMHLVGRPYMKGWELLDGFETSGLVVCFAMMWTGIVFYTSHSPSWLRECATVSLMFLNLCYVLFTVVVLLNQKGVEESPIAHSCRKVFFCVPDNWLLRASEYIPAIQDGAQNWMAEDEPLFTFRRKRPITMTTFRKTEKDLQEGSEGTFQQKNPRWSAKGSQTVVNVAVGLRLSDKNLRVPIPKETKNVDEENKLPPGWAKYQSNDGHQNDYYFNSSSGKSQWTIPR
jgi:hypothetical protein